jgi:hypothetical protein
VRPRNNSATTEGESEASSNNNLSKKRREENKEREAGGYRETRNWPLAGPHHQQQDRGFGYMTNRYEDRYGPGGFGGGNDNYHAGSEVRQQRGRETTADAGALEADDSTSGSGIWIQREKTSTVFYRNRNRIRFIVHVCIIVKKKFHVGPPLGQ